MKRLRPKEKLVIYGILTLWVVVMFFMIKPSKTVVKYYEEYQVKSGDTLYKIAANYPHNDIRKLIYIIKDNNNTTANLQIGQTLIIPILEVD